MLLSQSPGWYEHVCETTYFPGKLDLWQTPYFIYTVLGTEIGTVGKSPTGTILNKMATDIKYWVRRMLKIDSCSFLL